MSVYDNAKQKRATAPAWKKQLTRELLRPKRNRFPRRRIFSPNVNSIWTMDLLDIHQFSRQNKNFRYILVVLDIFSRFAWARPLKDKTGVSVAKALEDIMTTSGMKPHKIWSDRGTEFYNATVARLFERNMIQLYSTHNEPKASIAERFIRTLRGKIESNFILSQDTVWYDILPELIREYNHSYHRSIGMSPKDATKPENYSKVFDNLYPKREADTRPPLHIGDKVRISVHKRLFEKGATANWSEEIFEISKVEALNPTVYRIKDLAGEEIDGAFYREQLQKTDQSIYRIDRIIRKRPRTGEVLVKWSGYPDQFDSWIPEIDVVHSGRDISHFE